MLIKIGIMCLLLGICDVLTSPLNNGVKGQSHQRSINVYTKDDIQPDGDSQIIRLELQPLNQPHSRHLDLNAANEIPNTDNTNLDSYGNPVTPFGEISGSINLDPIGFDRPDDEQKTVHSGGWDFKVPSYASGIIDTYSHVPPLGRNINFDDFSTPTPQTLVQKIPEPVQFLKKFNPEEVGTGPILFADKPTDGLLPPLFPNEQGPEVNTAAVQPPPKQHAAPTFRPSTGIAQPSEYPLSLPLSFNSNFGAAHSTPHQTGQSIASHQFTTTGSNGFDGQEPKTINTGSSQKANKFSGTFGGSTGFLGSQNKPGYAVKPDGSIAAPTGHVATTTGTFVEQLQHQHQTQPQSQHQPIPTTTQTVNKFSGTFGGQPQPQSQHQSTPTTTQTVNKFTGTFGGQPQHQSIPTTTQTVNKFTGTFGGQPQHQTQTQHQPQYQLQQIPTTTQTVNKFTGSFGVPQGHLGHQSHTTQRPQFQTTPIANKFGGSFGGSQGVLGQQAKPGYAAGSQSPAPNTQGNQGNGNFGASGQYYPQVASTTQSPFLIPTTQGNKFAGSFGGSSGSFNQQKPGYAIKPDGSQHQVQTNQYNGNFAGTPVNYQPFASPPSQKPFQATSSTGNKFSGTFGGSQGFLGQQAKPGYAVKPDGTIASTSGPQSQGNKYAGNFGGSAPDHQQATQNTNYDHTNRFTGNVGGSTPNHQQISGSTYHSSGKGSKFNGHFGGAPGVLGQQTAPGYAVKSDGTISHRQGLSDDHSGLKYTGSFNGPPGVLKPYDNLSVPLGVKTG